MSKQDKQVIMREQEWTFALVRDQRFTLLVAAALTVLGAIGIAAALGREARISALEQDVQTLIEFMPQVVEREASENE